MERKLSEKFEHGLKLDNKKYYYTYIVENMLDGKFYIGSHRTYDLLDGYMGSGLVLNRAISKHGKENFRFKIIQFHNTVNEMLQHEAELLPYDIVCSEKCYNLCWYDKNNINAGPITTFGSKWVTNDTHELFIRNTDIDIFLTNNISYRLGRMPTAYYVSAQGQINQANAVKDKITFYNQHNNTRKYFYKHELTEKFIAQLENIGYKISSSVFGQSNKATKDKTAITDGVSNRYVSDVELENMLNTGWRLGRTINRDNITNRKIPCEKNIKFICEYINSVDMSVVPPTDIKKYIIDHMGLLDSYFNKFLRRLPNNKHSSKYIDMAKLQLFIKNLKLS